MNKFPIVIFEECSADEIVKLEEFQQIINKYLKTKNIYLQSYINIRVIDLDNDDVYDRVFKTRDIMPWKN